jgi:hypothetical protein
MNSPLERLHLAPRRAPAEAVASRARLLGAVGDRYQRNPGMRLVQASEVYQGKALAAYMRGQVVRNRVKEIIGRMPRTLASRHFVAQPRQLAPAPVQVQSIPPILLRRR